MISDKNFDVPDTQKYDASLLNSGIKGAVDTVTDGFTSNESNNSGGNILNSKADASEKSECVNDSDKEDYKTIEKDDNTNHTDSGNIASEEEKITVIIFLITLLYNIATLVLYGTMAFTHLGFLCWFSLPSIISLFVTFFPLVFIFIAFLQNPKLLSIILAITGLLPTFSIFFWIISFVSINRRLKEKNAEKLSPENFLYERTLLAHYNKFRCKYRHTGKDFCPFLFKDRYSYEDYLKYYENDEDTIKILTKVYKALNGERSIYDKLYCYII